MQPRSSTLFHFTKNENILFDIFLNGFWPRYCLEDIQWQGFSGTEFVAFPMVCFCDIPLARISEHIGFYGAYGIGLTKVWAERNNMNPLLYVSSGSELCHSILETSKNSMSASTKKNDDVVNHVRYLVSHSKPTSGVMFIDGKPVDKEFYQESEWRYVPRDENVKLFLAKDDYENEDILAKSHALSKEHSSLKFLPSDVAYVFVPKDSDIPNVINFMQDKLDYYPSSDLKVLFSRVISIESIERDI